MTDHAPLPVACTLTVAEIVERKASLLPGLAERAVLREATTDGYRLQFERSSEVLQAITATIDAERQCCQFPQFDLVVAAAGGRIELTPRAVRPGRANFWSRYSRAERP